MAAYIQVHVQAHVGLCRIRGVPVNRWVNSSMFICQQCLWEAGKKEKKDKKSVFGFFWLEVNPAYILQLRKCFCTNRPNRFCGGQIIQVCSNSNYYNCAYHDPILLKIKKIDIFFAYCTSHSLELLLLNRLALL